MNDEITPMQILIMIEELLEKDLITKEKARSILMGMFVNPPKVTMVRKKRI